MGISFWTELQGGEDGSSSYSRILSRTRSAWSEGRQAPATESADEPNEPSHGYDRDNSAINIEFDIIRPHRRTTYADGACHDRETCKNP